jgi:hypothetical protein
MFEEAQFTVWLHDGGEVDDPDDLRHGPFDDFDEANVVCEEFLDGYLAELVGAGLGADEVFAAFTRSGVTAWISCPGVADSDDLFSAQAYVRAFCEAMRFG